MGKMYTCGCVWGGDEGLPSTCRKHGAPETAESILQSAKKRFTFEERDGIRIFTRNPCTPQQEYFCRVTDNKTGEIKEIVISPAETANLTDQAVASLFSEKLKDALTAQ